VAVSTVTLAVFTAAGVLEERRQLLDAESAHAAALLEHLARMPEFQKRAADAKSFLDVLRGSLGPVGASLDLAAPNASAWRDGPVLARRALRLDESPLVLRYRVDPERLREITRRSVLIHSLHGLVALVALLAGTEWILRRSLLAPLSALSHEVNLMRDGRGWQPRLPPTDQEFKELADALAGLGPGLERQVYGWIDVERRAAVARALTAARERLRGTQHRVLALLAELEDHDVAAPHDREQRIRSLTAEVRQLPEVLAAETQALFAAYGSTDARRGVGAVAAAEEKRS
jgi:hypothetical protein